MTIQRATVRAIPMYLAFIAGGMVFAGRTTPWMAGGCIVFFAANVAASIVFAEKGEPRG